MAPKKKAKELVDAYGRRCAEFVVIEILKTININQTLTKQYWEDVEFELSNQ